MDETIPGGGAESLSPTALSNPAHHMPGNPGMPPPPPPDTPQEYENVSPESIDSYPQLPAPSAVSILNGQHYY
ncbi:hypothetical protein NQZ68_031911 [Dissostichus eleginoides]|nr:hypothetical protein NQZ68_031911 [Dissostichus eleginoides]